MARILIAEDERDIRELLFFTLYFDGHDVLTATNGEEAYTTTLQEMPDLVILDVGMPRMSGLEACRMIKSEKSTRDIPVIFLSAKSLEAEIKAGLEAGAVEYLIKPFAPDLLIEKVRKILEEQNR
jgi:DNA-binding response OmpR family regulator